MKATITLSCCALALSCAANAARAVTADELAAEQRARDLALARKDIAEANAAEARARLGTLSVERPKGTGVAEGLNVEAKILAYSAVDRIAAQIAQEIKSLPAPPVHVVISSQRELSAVMQYRAYQQQTRLLQRQIGQASGGTPAAPKLPPLDSDGAACVAERSAPADDAGGAAPLVAIDAALQVLSLFKSDKKIDGIDVEVDEFALAMSVLGHLRRAPGSLSVAYPASVLPGVLAAGASSNVFALSPALKELNALVDGQVALDTVLGLIGPRREALRQLAQGRTATAPCKAMWARDTAQLDRLEASVKALKGAIDQLATALSRVDESSGASALQSLVMAETLASKFAGAHVLQLKPVAAGGATLAKTNLFTTNFYFSGGAIVSYLLYNGSSGDVVLAATMPYYAGFIKASRLPSGSAVEAAP